MDYQNLYNKLYEYGDYRSNGAEKKDHTIPVLKKLIGEGYKFNNILDCGSAIGNALLFLKEQKYDAMGVEVSDIAVKRANNRGLNSICGSITKIPIHDRKFDLVTCTDVIEHLVEKDVPIALYEMLRLTKKYCIIKPATRPERNRHCLLKVKEKFDIKVDQLHLTVKPITWYVKQIKNTLKSLQITNFKIQEIMNETLLIEIN